MKGQSKAKMIAKVPTNNPETESAILGLEPEAESLDWICYRLRGGRDPAGDAALPKPPAPSSWTPEERPAREDVERALRRLETLGLLTCAGRRWSITARGPASTDPPRRPDAPCRAPPDSAPATSR